MKGLMSKGEWMKKRTDNEITELYWNRDDSAIRETETKYGNYRRTNVFGTIEKSMHF